jgi:hypothetical protein
VIKINKNECDKSIAPEVGRVLSFMFVDPDLKQPTNNRYCVGLKYKGGKLSDPSNWEYDHTNYFDADNDPKLELKPKTISREELETVLKRHESTIDYLSKEYIKILNIHGETRSELRRSIR